MISLGGKRLIVTLRVSQEDTKDCSGNHGDNSLSGTGGMLLSNVVRDIVSVVKM